MYAKNRNSLRFLTPLSHLETPVLVIFIINNFQDSLKFSKRARKWTTLWRTPTSGGMPVSTDTLSWLTEG